MLIIRDPQLEALREGRRGTLTGRLVAHVTRHFPGYVERHGGLAVASRVADAVARAHVAGVTSERDLCRAVCLCLAAPQTFEGFLAAPAAERCTALERAVQRAILDLAVQSENERMREEFLRGA